MNKRWIVLPILLIVLLGLYFLINSGRSTSIQELFTDEGINRSEITSIDTVKSSTDEKVSITEPKQINKIVTEISKLQLKEENFTEAENSQSYWVTIKANNERRLGMTFFDQDFLSIYNFKDKKQYNYKITDNSNINAIKDLFK
ncbi:hypothetical protein ACH0BF_16315 [Pseudobacillus sp. 179-B 2D1 NHS]|uniref:hypothetical protein n=1 Tax=Pseudobacillus sp. 179-B 2D1 NHS TaxID=3374292 RepID=UPI0038799A19